MFGIIEKTLCYPDITIYCDHSFGILHSNSKQTYGAGWYNITSVLIEEYIGYLQESFS